MLLAIVTLHRAAVGRQYRLPEDRDYAVVLRAMSTLDRLVAEAPQDELSPVPREPLPPIGTLGFRVQRYGMTEWGDLFTARQKLALVTIAHAVKRKGCVGLALALGKLADLATSGCLWHRSNECPNQVLTTGRIRPFWDFAEGVPTSESSGGFQVCVEKLIGGVLSASVGRLTATVAMAPAQQVPLGGEVADIWFTDPPYYDAIAYADLSDFFFVWLKRALPGHPLLRDPFDASNPLTPKAAEAVQDETKLVNNRPKDRAFFEKTMALAFAEGKRVTRGDGVGSVVFAHKTTEGWEALLSGMTKGGWVITASWPVATEMTTRLRARDSAALATSVHLVCRPRTEDRIGDWAEVLRELPGRVGDWMTRLGREGVRGADLVFACIGPALEIFSRYSRVETPDGSEVPLAEYLEKVWEVVGRAALEQVLGTAEAQARNGGAGALEEDARLTALFLWTLKSTVRGNDAPAEEEEDAETEEDEDEGVSKGPAKGFSLVYDMARRFAQPLGIHLETWEGRIIETDKGVVRLMPVRERARQLFGEEGAAGLADRIERAPKNAAQLELFPAMRDAEAPKLKGRQRRGAPTGEPRSPVEATTLDRVHAAMLLQAGGQANALRALLKAEQERGADFLRLANALSALYPTGSDEKRLLDAMLLAVPR